MLRDQVSAPTEDWNVVVTTFEGRGLRHARRFLASYGEVSRTHFHNVLVVKVPDVSRFLRSVAEVLRADVQLLNDVSRMAPAQATFDFSSAQDFEHMALAIALGWADQLTGRSFHVRLNQRRGDLPFKLSSLAEERAINEAILRKLEGLGRPGRIEFADPDYVIDIETVGRRAGMSIWSREDLKQFPFLRPD
jgi:tRNA(Ser,Leu) C12 N-acetylase TAN1